mmetsp:Transcript_103322/g.280719  ORF Transcript_103322/g.280719 Transcript_103322/m.280719 type:complete len:205 (-) Transcript_103322:338-952(-)
MSRHGRGRAHTNHFGPFLRKSPADRETARRNVSCCQLRSIGLKSRSFGDLVLELTEVHQVGQVLVSDRRLGCAVAVRAPDHQPEVPGLNLAIGPWKPRLRALGADDPRQVQAEALPQVERPGPVPGRSRTEGRSRSDVLREREAIELERENHQAVLRVHAAAEAVPDVREEPLPQLRYRLVRGVAVGEAKIQPGAFSDLGVEIR